MTDTRKARLRDSLDSALSNLMAVLPGVDNEPGWDALTSDEGWTVRQLLAHLGSAEAGLNSQIKNAIQARDADRQIEAPTGRNGEPFDLDRWNNHQVEKRLQQPPSALRVELTETRTQTLRTLAAHSDTDLTTKAWTPAIGYCTVEDIYKIMAVHMKDHTRAIKAALRSSYGHYWGEGEAQGRE